MRVADGLVVALGLFLAGSGCRKPANQEPPGGAAAPAATAAKVAAPGSDPCAPLCERTRRLACKKASACAAHCRDMMDVGGCKQEMAEVLGCFAREPVEHWECDEQGEPAIKEGYCDREQARFVSCAERRAGAAPRPL